MSLTFTILGCGSSGGVPRVGAGWGACDPLNPKNQRLRCSLLIERDDGGSGRTTVLIDASPDLRAQLLAADVCSLDAVLFTHEHADHTHGIDDLRPLAIHLGRRIDIYADEPTSRALRDRFGYCFATRPGSPYPPILNEHRIAPGQPVAVHGAGGAVVLLPYLQDHGDIVSLGLRVGAVAYSSDLRDLPLNSVEALEDLDVWIVDALRYRDHPTHFSVAQALAWIERIRPRRAILTNLHSDLDYETLRQELPANVEPAFDGMKIIV
jgi:phosphoribosyl 1,2-cyclic phosphate phosphodiesterase